MNRGGTYDDQLIAAAAPVVCHATPPFKGVVTILMGLSEEVKPHPYGLLGHMAAIESSLDSASQVFKIACSVVMTKISLLVALIVVGQTFRDRLVCPVLLVIRLVLL